MTFHKYLETQYLLESRQALSEFQRPISECYTGKEVKVYCENHTEQKLFITLYGRIQN